ncbi:MAG: hypothetical protein ACTMKU_02020, partial [Actinomycetaceae bacterium]
MPDLRLPRLVAAAENSSGAVRAGIRSGRLIGVGRGLYAVAPDESLARWEREEYVHLARSAAAARLSGAVLSHLSAAAVWGLPLPPGELSVHVTQPTRPSPGHDVGRLVRHQRPLGHDDVADASFGVTSLRRTVIDSVSLLPPIHGLALADAALRLASGAHRYTDARARTKVDELKEGWIARIAAGARHAVRARAVLRFADPRADSPGESRARWVLLAAGLPVPELQEEVSTPAGHFEPDLTFGPAVDRPWSTVHGEYDGSGKYVGAAGHAALMKEKEREDALRSRGATVLRIVAKDLRPENREALARR